MDIEAWLQGLGLERYAPAFRDNEIDWEVLPKLTSEDLSEIGVAAFGHRRPCSTRSPHSAQPNRHRQPPRSLLLSAMPSGGSLRLCSAIWLARRR